MKQSEISRAKAIHFLRHSFEIFIGATELGALAQKPSNLPAEATEQRRMIIDLASQLIDGEFESTMDMLCNSWMAYRQLTREGK